MAAKVRVGIVSWNTAALLRSCLAALPSALGGLDASVTVVDNASTDGSAEVAEEAGVEVVRNSTNRGYARAMNQALGRSSADVLIALNPDTEPPAGSLATLTERLLAAPGVGLVAPRLVNPDGSLQHSAYTFPSPLQAAAVSFLPARLRTGRIGRRLWLEGAAPHDRPCDVEWVIGAVHVLRAEAVPDPRQPYSERWFMYVEDLDLCWRLARSGWRRRLEADVSVPHVGGASASQAGIEPRQRWTPLSYDWYAETHGTPAMRRWAAVNTLGTAWMAGAAALTSVHGGPVKRAEVLQLARLVPLHARFALGRPPGPA
ncbi:MAG TPA: glycosyltransferase [Acidimicrobiales bacterium]|nr:glycosyltransferase [Acidimicrobiales bacterium]